MQSLRRRLIAVALGALSIPSRASMEGQQIAVAVSSNAPAFEEAVGAFKTALGEDSAQMFFVQLDNKEPSKSLFGAARPRVAVAFGSRAFEAFAVSDPAVPLLVTMVLSNDSLAKPQQLVSTVSLSVSPASILSQLKSAFPGRKRLAVLLGPGSSSLRAELSALAQRLGYVLEVVECAGPRDVLEAFGALRGRVDFVWCLPDSNLYPAAAIPPILLASIRNQLPVIGFSEGFVRAGAAVGFYPDYAEIGIQTAESVKRYLSRQELPRVESPRKVRMAVNDRVLRILGVERPNLSTQVLVIR
jgi:putative ABC transport system substrate-binding protein